MRGLLGHAGTCSSRMMMISRSNGGQAAKGGEAAMVGAAAAGADGVDTEDDEDDEEDSVRRLGDSSAEFTGEAGTSGPSEPAAADGDIVMPPIGVTAAAAAAAAAAAGCHDA